MLPDRAAATLEAWLRKHPEVEVVCRDGSATYAEAIRRALPDAVQVADRWHLWHNLREAALSEVKAHSICWAAVLDAPIYNGPAHRRPWNAGTRSTACSTRAWACSNAPATCNWPRTPSNATREPTGPNGCSASPSTAPASSTPIANTYANAGTRDPAVPIARIAEECVGSPGLRRLRVNNVNATRIHRSEWRSRRCGQAVVKAARWSRTHCSRVRPGCPVRSRTPGRTRSGSATVSDQ